MLSALTQPNYPNAALGIERDAVTALTLRRAGRGRYSLSQAATVAVPNDLLRPGFLEKNIASPREFLAILQDAVETAGLMKQKKWSVSLPSTTARSVILTLEPDSVKGDLEEVLDWKAEQSFGAPAAELRITRYKLPDDADGRSRYFASAVKLSVIDEYETVFERLGWKAGLILPRAVSESNWLASGGDDKSDSLLISSQHDGFTAVLLRGSAPAVVRSVTCTDAEVDDEIYRLLMFYKDRFANEASWSFLNRVLVAGGSLVPEKIRAISGEALGRMLTVLGPDDIGLDIPDGSLRFDDLAAPAGLASLAWA
jgi:hypothetical protein